MFFLGEPMRKTSGFLLVICTMILSSCTGTNVSVNPDPNTYYGSSRSSCGAIAIREIPGSRIYPAAGNLIPDFARSLERSGLASKVYYPSRPDDKVDMVIDAKFDTTSDKNIASNMVQAFFTGLLLFIPEPIIWYDYDYAIDGQIDIIKNGNRMATLTPKVTSKASVKWLSLSSLENVEQTTLVKSKDSIYKQIITDLSRYCDSK